MRNKIAAGFLFFAPFAAVAKTAEELDICGKLAQGEIVVARARGDETLVAFGRDADLEQTVSVGTKTEKVKIAPTKWDVQTIAGLPGKKVTPAKTDEKEIAREYADVRDALKPKIAEPYWKTGFIKPVEGRASGNFGGQRIMNGVKKNPHNGMDIAAPEGTEVRAPADGVITLASGPYFYSGNVVVIAHGQGLFTIYAHLNSMNVRPGDKVKQGGIIGAVGKTGRATGAHLHWGASLSGTRFNPASLLELGKCL